VQITYNQAIKDRPQKGLWAGPSLLRSLALYRRRYIFKKVQ